MSGAPVLVAAEGAVARLTLNRPDKGNLIDQAMAEALVAAAQACDRDAAIRCVVLTGAGRFFCAGGDLGLFGDAGARLPLVLSDLANTLHKAVACLARMRKPLLVLANGPAAGGGLSLALAGDVVLAARSAHFMTAYGTIGLSPDGGMSWLLPRLVGLRRAQELLMTNRRLTAEEAEAIGLVTRMVDDDVLEAEGAAVAAQLAAAPTAALAAARSLLLDSFGAGLEAQLAGEAAAIAMMGATDDSREGVAAFRERRPPHFTGC
jgi:2-(1,2-epoxy-1,2-dihydrophenyl)acetyl-CoA isomerase